ncbi:transport and golgi organization 2 homolog [Phtheirospermum japonicum]|uniref:Transport and golgi organization 2 homolog n=1 Tax=Phtheirospermum japonicum TaxID=374723 RepID=A0A830B446_9LAMI|nr:transport and golgi organization 2 homolog [Phtheirospermum japonicum]
MCIAVFMWQAHPLYPFLLLLNRDEYHNRQAYEAGGMVERWGNIRRQRRSGRWDVAGMLETRQSGFSHKWAQSSKSPKTFAEELVKEANQYNGFNLIVADLVFKSMVYVSNRPKGEPVSIQEVLPGIHVLSNATLNSPWPKAERLELSFKQEVGQYSKGEIPVKEMVEKLMRDRVKADESELPKICSPDWEFGLSSIFVEVDTPLGKYGTRSTAALTVKASGEASFYEIYLEGDIWKQHTLNYHIQKL